MPRFDRLSNAFKEDSEFQGVMSHFYEDILEFHRRSYMFFRRRGESRISPGSRITLIHILCRFSLENCIRFSMEVLQFTFSRNFGEPEKAQGLNRP